MKQGKFLVAAILATALGTAASADPIAVKHTQGAMRGFLVVRSDAGKIIGSAELSQIATGDEVTVRLKYTFLDGSIDDETTTYTQRGTFRLVRDHHIQKGPFFEKPVDIAVDAHTEMVTTRTLGKDGKPAVENQHMDLPDDLTNGFIGTLLLNVQHNVAPFTVGMLAASGKGRLVKVAISAEGEQPFRVAGRTLKATVFRIHPELGGLAGVIAPMIGKEPKDTTVWVLEGEAPAVVRIVGQLDGSGAVISTELMGNSFGK